MPCYVVPEIVLSDNLSVYKFKLPVWSVKINYDMDTSVTGLLWGFHWLSIRTRIQYKVLLIVYKAFTSSKSSYVSDILVSKKQM